MNIATIVSKEISTQIIEFIEAKGSNKFRTSFRPGYIKISKEFNIELNSFKGDTVTVWGKHLEILTDDDLIQINIHSGHNIQLGTSTFIAIVYELTDPESIQKAVNVIQQNL